MARVALSRIPPRMTHHRRTFLRRGAALTLPGVPLAWLGGCAGLGGPTVITLGEAELAQLVSRAFPLQRRLFELLEVDLAAPAVRLQPERNRLAVALDIAAQERLFSKAAKGRLVFDSALRYEPVDASVRLQQVRVSQLSLDGGAVVPGAVAAALPAAAAPAPGASAPATSLSQRLGQALAERMLENLSIYRLSPERLASLRQLGLQPGAVTVTARGVEITLARAA